MVNSKNVYYVIASAIWLLLSYSIFVFLSDEEIISLAREDNVIEMVGAILFLMTSILFFIIFLNNKKKTKLFSITNIFLFLLGCTFLFGFLEEISWGQRIFNFPTPQLFQESNLQNEFNLHNLERFHGLNVEGQRKSFWALFLNFDRLFSIFWFTFCFLTPIIYNLNLKTKTVLDSINFPVVPLSLGVFFIINYGLSKIIEFQINADLTHSLVETKETAISFLFFLVGMWFIKE
jgi:hypothetical protein